MNFKSEKDITQQESFRMASQLILSDIETTEVCRLAQKQIKDCSKAWMFVVLV